MVKKSVKKLQYLYFLVIKLILIHRAIGNLCDPYLENLLRAQDLLYICDLQQNIIVDGQQQIITMEAIITKEIKTNINQIAFMNFKELRFQKIVIDDYKRLRQLISLESFFIFTQNESLTFEEIDIFCGNADNIMYFEMRNNTVIEIENLLIKFNNGYSPDMIYQNPLNLKQQTIVLLADNNQTQIQNYQFIYFQCDKELQEYNDFVGVQTVNNHLVVSSLQVELMYNKHALQSIQNVLIQVLQVFNQFNQIMLDRVNFNLTSFSTYYGFYQESALIQFKCQNEDLRGCGNIQINDLTVQNMNFVLDILNAEYQDNFILKNVQVINNKFEDTNLVNSVNRIKRMISFTQQVNVITINNLSILNSDNKQYFYVLFLSCSVSQQSLNLDFIEINNSSWYNTIVYLFTTIIPNYQNIFLSMKNSSYKGVDPLMFIASDQLVLKVDLDFQHSLSLMKGLIQINHNNNVTLLDSKVVIGKQADSLYFGRGGLIQFIMVDILKVTDFLLECYSFVIISSKLGGILYLEVVSDVHFNKINAFGFQIDGSGGFANILLANYVLIESCSFDSFYAGVAGGALFISYNKQLTMKDIIIRNSEAGLGGGLYLDSTEQNADSAKLSNINIDNCFATIGCAMATLSSDFINLNITNNPCQIPIQKTITSLRIKKYTQINPALHEPSQQVIDLSGYQLLKKNTNTTIILHDFEVNIKYFITFDFKIGDEWISFKDLKQKTENIIHQNSKHVFNLKKEKFTDCDQYDENKQYQNNQQATKGTLFKNLEYLLYFGYAYNDFMKDTNLNIVGQDFKIDMGPFSKYEVDGLDEFYLVIEQQKEFSPQVIVTFFSFSISFYFYELTTCQPGQIRVKLNEKQICQYCNDYQAIKNLNSTECFKCKYTEFNWCSGNLTYLSPGYYYEFQYISDNTFNEILQNATNPNYKQVDINSTQIFKCTYPQNCVGGLGDTDFLCQKTHIGPLCGECDRYCRHWDVASTKSNSQECQICSSYSTNLTFTILFIIGLFILIACLDILLFLQFKSIMGNVEEKMRVSTTVHLKIMLFFAQIINVCSFYRSPQILKSLFNFEIYIYNPFTNSFLNFFECFLIQHFPEYNAPHLMVSIQAILPLLMILLYLFLRFAIKSLYNWRSSEPLDSLKRIYLNHRSFMIQITLYSINTFYFSIIQGLISGIFCQDLKQLGQFSSLDLTITCDDTNRNNYLNLIYYPFLAFYGVVFPLTLLTLLVRYRKQREQDSEYDKFMIGFLYQDYRKSFFFWELLRFGVKVLITIAAQPSTENTNNIGISVISILAIYLIILVTARPYILDKSSSLRYRFSSLEIFFDFTDREAGMLISGILLISSYILNTVSFQSDYYSESDIFPIIIQTFGHLQSILFLSLMLFIFFKYLFLKIQSGFSRWLSKRRNRKLRLTDDSIQK